jgi:hypothetical protein
MKRLLKLNYFKKSLKMVKAIVSEGIRTSLKFNAPVYDYLRKKFGKKILKDTKVMEIKQELYMRKYLGGFYKKFRRFFLTKFLAKY